MYTWLLGLLALALGIAVAVLVFRLRRLEEWATPLQKRLEEASDELRENRSLFQHLMESLQDAVVIVTSEGTITTANPTAYRLLGAGILGHTLLERTLCYELQLLLTRCVQTQHPQQAELQLSHPRARTVLVRILPLHTVPRVAEAAYLLVLTDISELRRLEKVRSDFVANVSHELRTPLAAIRATAEAMIESPPDDPEMQKRFLSTIVEQTARLTRITEDLLILANVEAHPVPQAQLVELQQVVCAVVRQVSPLAQKNGVTVTSEVPEGFTVFAQRDQLEQILLNLIDNAVKYNRPGGHARVRAHKVAEGSEIIIEDTGIGIPHEHLSRIFERFYRVDKARSRAKGGTGLGLSIVKHLVESHGGRVWVHSEMNVGSSFGVVLPDRCENIHTVAP